MKRTIAMIAATTVLLTGCGHNDYINQVVTDDSTVHNPDTTTTAPEAQLETLLIETTSNKEEGSEINMDINVIFHDTPLVISDTKDSFIDMVEEVITTNCIIGLELQETLNDHIINKYSSEGYCIQIQYTNPHIFDLSNHDNVKSLEISKIVMLIDTENNQSRIGIVCDTNLKVYHMSNESVEEIINFFK